VTEWLTTNSSILFVILIVVPLRLHTHILWLMIQFRAVLGQSPRQLHP
jgi:hypothetical protein